METTVAMPAMSRDLLERVSRVALLELCPEMLEGPRPLPVGHLVGRVLPRAGIDVYPCTWLPHEAMTYPREDGGAVILLQEQDFERISLGGGREGNRARATFAHELAHAILHVPQMRRMAGHTPRVPRAGLEAFRDAEWQAWCLAGCLLAPPAVLRRMDRCSVGELGDVFRVSVGLLEQHCRRYRVELDRAA